MKTTSPVIQVLEENDIAFRLFRHSGPIRSLEQAAADRGQRPEQVVRSILFRIAEDQFVMVLVAGGGQVSWPALRHFLGQSRLTMASPEEVLEVTGYPIGGVSPLGTQRQLRVLVDESVLAEEEISLGSGIRGTTVILAAKDLLSLLNGAEIGQFSQ